jgi:hypothetical protein
MRTPSLAGAKYFDNNNDFSKKSWVYFLKYKSNALETFQEFRATVER